MISSRKLLLLIFLIISLGVFAFFQFNISRKLEMRSLGLGSLTQGAGEPASVAINRKTKIKYPQDYTIVMLGDSMTERLGNSDELRAYLKKYYPTKSFEVLNYGYGSTNILSAQARLETETYFGRAFRPILDIAFDVILIESFGNNPLSEYPLNEGLERQNEALDKMVEAIRKENPAAKIVFVATIAPNRNRYAESKVNLDTSTRQKWADERIAYMKNHLQYAKDHQIPIIDIFSKSLKKDEGGNLDYISTDDFIHPSPSGVYFISEEIAKSLFENKILTP